MVASRKKPMLGNVSAVFMVIVGAQKGFCAPESRVRSTSETIAESASRARRQPVRQPLSRK